MTQRVVISTVLWDANPLSQDFSRCYSPAWALRLFNAFNRHLTVPHSCVLFTDRWRSELPDWIAQIVKPGLGANGYGDCVVPFCLDEPMIFAGLDTLILRNVDKLARYCLEADKIALPKHPYEDTSINGVVLTPARQRRIFDDWRGENDMEWMRTWPHNRIDDLWPGRVVSYKAKIAGRSDIGKPAIVYFHGKPKMHQLMHLDLVRENWR